MFKKTIAISLSLLVAASLGTNTFAAELNQDDAGKMIAAIDKTNQDIELRITKAIEAADQLESQYLLDIQKLEEGDAVVNLKEQKNKLESDLQKTNDVNKINKINSDLEEINNKLAFETDKVQKRTAAIESEINSLPLFSPDNDKTQKKLDDLQKQLNQKLDKYNDRTNKFTNDLVKLISDLYNQTLNMSNETIKKAAEKGIQAESTWTLVELGGKQVWVDPIRVVH